MSERRGYGRSLGRWRAASATFLTSATRRSIGLSGRVDLSGSHFFFHLGQVAPLVGHVFQHGRRFGVPASLAQSADRSRNHSTFKFTSTLRMTRLHQRGCHDSDPKSFSNSQNWRKLSRITGRGRDGIGYVFKNGARLCSPMRRDGKPSD